MSSMSTMPSSNNRTRKFSDEMYQNERNDGNNDLVTMDEKRVRKAVFRRTIDYNASISLQQEQRLFKRRYSHRNNIQPDIHYQHLLTTPHDYMDNPMNCVCAKHVRTSTNKNKCPIYSLCWTPDGRRLITGASSGEFTLWNGLTFNFETILQAHDTHIKAMKWSHNEDWLLSGDDLGMVKYWQANMNDVNVFQAHKDAVRGLSFCPSDKKFVTCSVDNTVRIWDFQLYREERVLRGHGGEVKCVAWHPTKALVLSGSKDSQQPLKLWDPKAGDCISTLYVHKNSCNDISINKNGNWFLSASKDHTIKLFDLRNLRTEMQVFRGHKKDVFRVAWHPFHENLFASGSGDGALMYWMAGTDKEVGSVDDAHDNIISSLDWHPMGHILATGSNDFATKFWTRNRPGDVLKDNAQTDLNVSAAKVSETNHTTDAELANIMKRVKEDHSLADLDLQGLSSSIEADLENSDRMISDIPGLSEGIIHDLDVDAGDQSSEESEAHSRSVANRMINKQFASNWAEKRTFVPAPTENHKLIEVPFKGVGAGKQGPSTPGQSSETSHQYPNVTPLMSNVQPLMNAVTSHPRERRTHQSEKRPLVIPLLTIQTSLPKTERFLASQNSSFQDSPHPIGPPQGHHASRPNSFTNGPDLMDAHETQGGPNHPSHGHPPFQHARPPNRGMPNFSGPRDIEHQNPDFQGQDFQGSNFPGQDFPSQEFQGPNFPGPDFHDPNFPGQDFQGPPMGPSRRPLYMSPRAQRMPPRNFRDQNHPDAQFDGPRPPHRPPHANNVPIPFDQPHHPNPRNFYPNNPCTSYDAQEQMQRAPPRNFGPNFGDMPYETQEQSQRPPQRHFHQNSSENPFEPQKSTGSSKGFIPLPFNNGEAPNMRGRQRRSGSNW